MNDLYRSVVIAGDRGMLAHALRSTLSARNIACAGFDRDDCDITQIDAVRAWFDRNRPSLVLNCAAYTNVDGCEANADLARSVNGTGVGNLARACQEAGAMLVHYSTDYVFDGNARQPLRPSDPTGPQSVYGESKLLGEQLMQQHPPNRWLILRTAWLYGPNGPNFPSTMVNLARQGKPLKVIHDQIGSPTFTFDLAEATMNLIDADADGIWHLSNSGQTSWYDFTKAILAEFSLQTDLAPITSADWKALKPTSAVRPAYSVFDISPYERLTKKKMPAWQDALHRYRLMVEAAGTP